MSVGFARSTISRLQRALEVQRRLAGCLKARLGDARRRYLPGGTDRRLNRPFWSVVCDETRENPPSASKERSCTGDPKNGAPDASLMWPSIGTRKRNQDSLRVESACHHAGQSGRLAPTDCLRGPRSRVAAPTRSSTSSFLLPTVRAKFNEGLRPPLNHRAVRMLRSRLSGVSDSFLPADWVSAPVKAGEDADRLVRFDVEHQRIREALQQGVPILLVNDRKLARVGAHPFHGCVNFGAETTAKTWRLVVVPFLRSE